MSRPTALLLISTTVILFAGCTSFQRSTKGQWIPGERFDSSGVIGVMPPSDAEQPKLGRIAGSGAALGAAIRDSLLRRGLKIRILESSVLSEAGPEAGQSGCTYLLKSFYTEWEQHSTEWSAIPTSATGSAELYDVKSRTLLATATHRDAGSNVSFVHRNVSRYVPEIADAIVATLTGTRPLVFVGD